jgi:tRNA1(Val) A37 N6-methylase TrmN6
VQGDVRNLPRALLAKTFDVVTCNPPYHKQQPGGDPTRFETACGIGDVFGAAARLLRFMGRLCICHRPERLPELMAGMQSFRIEPKRMRLVAYKTGNKPRLVLLEGKLGAKPGLDVLPTLVLADVFGTMTPEVAEMYRRR